jgi:hypothetical protein
MYNPEKLISGLFSGLTGKLSVFFKKYKNTFLGALSFHAQIIQPLQENN